MEQPEIHLQLELHQKQGTALQSEATEILYGGAAGGGKSHLMRVAAIIWCYAIPGLQIYLFRRVYDDLVKNHFEGPTSFPVLLAEWVQSKLVKINYSDLTIEFWNGSKIFLQHCQHEKDRFKYQGYEFHVLMIDELTHFTEKIYRYLRGRVRLGGFKIPEPFKHLFPRIICGGNPGGIGHNFVKFSFIDGAPALEIRRMPKKEGGMLRQFIPAKLEDNRTLMENDPDYADKLEGLGDPELVRAMLDGDWDIVAGGMFDDLWKRDIHVIKPFDIPESWYVDRSFDWGDSHPFGVLWWAESDGTTAPNGITYPRGTIFLISEYYGWNGKPDEGLRLISSEIAEEILEREETMLENGLVTSILPGPADTNIFNSDPIVGISLADDMEKVGVKWERADKSPGSRKIGWQHLRKYLKASLPHIDKTGRLLPMEDPGIFIFNTCPQWIRTVPVLPRLESDPEDVNTKAEDHLGDATRYRLMYVRPSTPRVGPVGTERISPWQ
jgi:hypothetical protein